MQYGQQTVISFSDECGIVCHCIEHYLFVISLTLLQEAMVQADLEKKTKSDPHMGTPAVQVNSRRSQQSLLAGSIKRKRSVPWLRLLLYLGAVVVQRDSSH